MLAGLALLLFCVYVFELMGPRMVEPGEGKVVVGGGLHSDDDGAWFDVQCTGSARDFCRYVGNPRYFSCALHGHADASSTKRGEYRPSDFKIGGSRAHRSCDASATAKVQLPRNAPMPPPPPSMIGTPAAQQSVPPAEVPIAGRQSATSWARVEYARTRFDHHEAKRGAEVVCRRTDGGAIELRGTIQCLTARADCWDTNGGYGALKTSKPYDHLLHGPELPVCPAWGGGVFGKNSVLMMTVPEICQPATTQHLRVKGFPVDMLVTISPTGSVMGSTDVGATEWFRLLDGVASSEGELS